MKTWAALITGAVIVTLIPSESHAFSRKRVSQALLKAYGGNSCSLTRNAEVQDSLANLEIASNVVSSIRSADQACQSAVSATANSLNSLQSSMAMMQGMQGGMPAGGSGSGGAVTSSPMGGSTMGMPGMTGPMGGYGTNPYVGVLQAQQQAQQSQAASDQAQLTTLNSELSATTDPTQIASINAQIAKVQADLSGLPSAAQLAAQSEIASAGQIATNAVSSFANSIDKCKGVDPVATEQLISNGLAVTSLATPLGAVGAVGISLAGDMVGVIMQSVSKLPEMKVDQAMEDQRLPSALFCTAEVLSDRYCSSADRSNALKNRNACSPDLDFDELTRFHDAVDSAVKVAASIQAEKNLDKLRHDELRGQIDSIKPFGYYARHVRDELKAEIAQLTKIPEDQRTKEQRDRLGAAVEDARLFEPVSRRLERITVALEAYERDSGHDALSARQALAQALLGSEYIGGARGRKAALEAGDDFKVLLGVHHDLLRRRYLGLGTDEGRIHNLDLLTKLSAGIAAGKTESLVTMLAIVTDDQKSDAENAASNFLAPLEELGNYLTPYVKDSIEKANKGLKSAKKSGDTGKVAQMQNRLDLACSAALEFEKLPDNLDKLCGDAKTKDLRPFKVHAAENWGTRRCENYHRTHKGVVPYEKMEPAKETVTAPSVQGAQAAKQPTPQPI